jgi:hypothetical protein
MSVSFGSTSRYKERPERDVFEVNGGHGANFDVQSSVSKWRVQAFSAFGRESTEWCYSHRLISVTSTTFTWPGRLAFKIDLPPHAKILFSPPHHHFAHSMTLSGADSLASSLASSLSASRTSGCGCSSRDLDVGIEFGHACHGIRINR